MSETEVRLEGIDGVVKWFDQRKGFGFIVGPEGQDIFTHYSVIDRVSHKAAWVSLKPVTGRQHQLRAHMALIKHPIIGDPKYMAGEHGLMEAIPDNLHLHARRLVIPHPITGATLDVTAPLPEHMRKTWEMLGLDPDRYNSDADSEQSRD